MQKLISLVFFLTLIISQSLFPQAKSYFDGSYWGIITDSGQELPARYDTVGAFYNGIAFIKKGGKYGYINSKGVEIAPLKYTYVSDFIDEVARVGKDNFFGYVDKLGNEIIPVKYVEKSLKYLSDGLIRFEENGYWNYYDINEQKILKTNYDIADDCYFGTIKVYTYVDNKRKIEELSNSIDSLIKIITPRKIFKFKGYASISKRTDKNNIDDLLEVGSIQVIDSVFKLGYIDKKFLETYKDILADYIDIRKELEEINKKINNFYTLMYLNKSHLQYPKKYEDEINKHNELEDKLNAMLNEIYTKISYQKEEELIVQFNETIKKLKEEKAWGFINKEGKFIIEPKFKNPYRFISYNLCFENIGSGSNKRYKIFNRSGEFISDNIYKDFWTPSSKTLIVKKTNDKYVLLDINTGNEISNEYDYITYLDSTALKVSSNNLYGIINEFGNEIIPTKYEAIEILDGNNFLVKQYEYYGVFNNKGKLIIPINYDEIKVKNINIYSCRIGNNSQLFNSSGEKIKSLRQIDFKNFIYDETKEFKNGKRLEYDEEIIIDTIWYCDITGDGLDEVVISIIVKCPLNNDECICMDASLGFQSKWITIYRFDEDKILSELKSFHADNICDPGIIPINNIEKISFEKKILKVKLLVYDYKKMKYTSRTDSYKWNGYELVEVSSK